MLNACKALPMAAQTVSVDEVRRVWAERGFSCDVWTDPPGQEWRDFVHDVEELVLPIQGAIEVEFAGQCLRPRIGEEVLIPARTRHTVRNIGGTVARWLYGYKLR